MTLINVFLDDYRQSPQGFHLAKNTFECIQLLENHNIHHLSLDHDLGPNEPNGMAVVSHLLHNEHFPHEITIHSANAVGGKRMYHTLKQAQQEAHIPYDIKLLYKPLPLFTESTEGTLFKTGPRSSSL